MLGKNSCLVQFWLVMPCSFSVHFNVMKLLGVAAEVAV